MRGFPRSSDPEGPRELGDAAIPTVMSFSSTIAAQWRDLVQQKSDVSTPRALEASTVCKTPFRFPMFSSDPPSGKLPEDLSQNDQDRFERILPV